MAYLWSFTTLCLKAKFFPHFNNISDGRAVAHSTSQVGLTRDVRSNPHKGKAYIERGAGGGRSSGVPTPMYAFSVRSSKYFISILKIITSSAIYCTSYEWNI